MESLSKENGGSRSASKGDLNESTLPLLDSEEDVGGGGRGGEEKLELKERASTGGGDEKDDSKTEKMGGDEEETNEEKKKKKKSGREERTRSPSRVQTMTVGLSLLDRDDKRINDHVNIQFEDVLAEPEATHSLEGVWRLAFVVFDGSRVWFYRVLTALLALPCALVWGLAFALLSFVHIWLVSPLLRLCDLLVFFTKRMWSSLVHVACDPVFESLGLIFSNIRFQHRKETVVAA